MKKLTTEQVIRALERLSKGWPDDLMLGVFDQSVCIYDTSKGSAFSEGRNGCIDPEKVVESFPGIYADGGGA